MNRIKEILDKKGIKQTWLAEKLNKSFNMVNSYVQNRRQPSLDDLFKIANILSIDVRDLLDYEKNREEENISDSQTKKIPLVGRVACGTPILAKENIEGYIAVSRKLLKPYKNYFILKASGNSMNQAGINDGDLVLIRKQETAINKDLVVALIDDEATIKEFQKKDNMVILKPKSTEKKHQPIILTSNFRVQGIVETVIPV